MPRYIDADKFLRWAQEYCKDPQFISGIHNAPTETPVAIMQNLFDGFALVELTQNTDTKTRRLTVNAEYAQIKMYSQEVGKCKN